MGYSARAPCDSFGENGLHHALRIDDADTIILIKSLIKKDENAAQMFYKHYLRRKNQKKYKLMKKSMGIIKRFLQSYINQWRLSREEEEDDDEDERNDEN